MKLTAVMALFVCSLGPAAFAQTTLYTWVSQTGSDTNPCTRSSPCRTFSEAISKTVPNGQVNVLDAGEYGPFNINGSITIDGGGIATVTANGGSAGFSVNATGSDTVTIRRLQIRTTGAGLMGGFVYLARQVNFEDVVISGFSESGINVNSTMVEGQVRIDHCTIRDANRGVYAEAGQVAIVDSHLTGNGTAGIDATGAKTFVLASNCELTMNGRGIRSLNGATVRMTHNDIMMNSTLAWEAGAGGVIETHVDNRVEGDTLGTLTRVSYP